MSKGDKKRDETPIDFEPQPFRLHGRVPIPVNQTNWKYKSNFDLPPTRAEWLSTAGLDVVLGIIIFLFSTQSDDMSKWGIVVLLGAFMVYFTWLPLGRYLRLCGQKPVVREGIHKSKLEKKHPKRRKDYQ